MKRATVLLGVLLLATGLAAARGPTLEELPTIKEIQRLAAVAIEAARVAAAEAARDPKRELIDNYAQGVAGPYAWRPVVDILKDANEEDEYRQLASEAIRKAFEKIPSNDRRYDRVKKELCLQVVKLLNDNSQRVRSWVYGIFEKFWPGRARAISYNPEEPNARIRYNAYKDWQKYLLER